MDTMSETLIPLLSASAAFVGSHFLLSAGQVRGALIARIGRWAFLVLYSLVALASFIWMIMAYSRAPLIDLWPRMDWAYYLALVVMLPAAILLVCGILTPSPASVIGERALARPDPAPGILKVTRHPIMWAVTLWASVHVLNTADLASLIFFGAIGGLAFCGMLHLEARRDRDGGENWRRLKSGTSFVPFAAALRGTARIGLTEIGWPRIIGGVALYIALLFGHELMIGIVVTPW